MSQKFSFKKELAAIGIAKAYAGLGSVDGTPAAILRWNGYEEYATAANLDPEYMPEQFKCLVENWSDKNVEKSFPAR